MKKKTLSKLLTLVLILSILLSMTGCEALDYRKAVAQYNAGNFDAAAEIFSALGEYEDSRELVTRSQYWAAISRMEKGNFAEALPRFLKLGDYEDSVQRAAECKYQLAIALFQEGSLSDGEAVFLELGDYKQSAEYLRRIRWQKLYDAVAESGELQREENGKVYCITADAESRRLCFRVSRTKDMGYTFYDDLVLSLSRDSLLAEFTAVSTFSMDFLGAEIGSRQEGAGKFSVSTCTPQTALSFETFHMTVTDNRGNTTSSDDPKESLMKDALAENLEDLLDTIPQLLADTNTELTLTDIGFSALA